MDKKIKLEEALKEAFEFGKLYSWVLMGSTTENSNKRTSEITERFLKLTEEIIKEIYPSNESELNQK